MPQPTNSEIFGIFDRVTRLEYLPYPAVAYEEHFNTNVLLSLKRFSLLVEKVLGAVKTDGYDVVKDGTDIKVKTGILFFKEFIVKEAEDVVVDSFVAEDRNVILKITEVEYTYESHQSDVEEVVEGRSLSGPNQRRFTVEYLYQTGAVPADTATEFYLHLATVDSEGIVTKEIPSRGELIHELNTGETLITDQNYKTVDSEIKNFFTNKEVDFGSGSETALFVQSELIDIERSALLFRVEKIESLNYNQEIDSSVESVRSLYQNGLATRCRVKFAWNYKTTSGSGGNGTITIDNAGYESLNDVTPDFAIDDLVDYKVWFNDTWYVVTANTATASGETVMTVEDLSGETPDLSGTNASSSSPIIVHNGASEFQLRATDEDGKSVSVSVLDRVSGTSSPVKSEVWIELDFGRTQQIRLNSFSVLRFNRKSQFLGSGSFTQWGTETHNYAASPDFIPKFVNIPEIPTATVTLSDEDPYSLNFKLGSIDPVENDFAEAYEIIYNVIDSGTGPSGLSFSSGTFDHKEIIYNYPELQGKEKTALLKHFIPPGTEKDIEFKYRALVGQQAVSAVQTITSTFGFNKLGSPQNLSVEFQDSGLYEPDIVNDVFSSLQFADRLTNSAAVKITWDAVAGAKGYVVETALMDASDNVVQGSKKTQYFPLLPGVPDIVGSDGVVTSYTVGRKLQIKVAPLHLDSTRGQETTTVFSEDVDRLQAPTFGEVKADELGVIVNWTPVDQANHYEVFWSLSRNPQLSGDETPADQESMRTRNTKLRINAPAGSDIYVAVVAIDKFGRRSLDISRLQTKSGKIKDEPKLKTWSSLEKDEKSIAAGDNELINSSKWTQPIQILGVSVRALDGNYYEAGTTTTPADGQIIDHPVKVRLYRLGEVSNNVSVKANSLNNENLVGTETDPDRDPLLNVASNQAVVIDYINEHGSYDLFGFKAYVYVFYRYEDKTGEREEGVLRYNFNRDKI